MQPVTSKKEPAETKGRVRELFLSQQLGHVHRRSAASRRSVLFAGACIFVALFSQTSPLVFTAVEGQLLLLVHPQADGQPAAAANGTSSGNPVERTSWGTLGTLLLRQRQQGGGGSIGATCSVLFPQCQPQSRDSHQKHRVSLWTWACWNFKRLL